MTKKKTTFLGLQIPDNISKAISKDAELHFRGKSQHIIWILDRYLLELSDTVFDREKPKSYSAEDIKEMKDNYYNKEEE